MHFIIDNWIAFGAVFVFFLVILFVNMVLSIKSFGSEENIKNRMIWHAWLSLFVCLSAIPFIAGVIAQIARYVNKH